MIVPATSISLKSARRLSGAATALRAPRIIMAVQSDSFFYRRQADPEARCNFVWLIASSP
jgi:hypothetical protein